MKVDVYSRAQAEALSPELTTAVISITAPGSPRAALEEGWLDVLRLEFDDALQPSTAVPELVLFDEWFARRIHDFVDLYQTSDFMVHCEAGMSRSVGVAVFLHEAYEAEVTLHAAGSFSAANSLVTRMLLRKFWEKTLKS